ncbi:isoprenyl transferase [Lentisalinibacter salinarum]|uniref:isoprenyl transferase n=1 Tax=Lentisalinibacter salinarum TaxID=2992239 RepID=UPI00386CB548
MSNNPNSPPARLPRHVAVIMDGNGRWARRRGLPRQLGHRSGIGPVRTTVETCGKLGIEYLTLFAFSSENWSRPREEVTGLMRLFVESLKREVTELHENDVKLTFVGARERLPGGLVNQMEEAERRTADNTGLRLVIAAAYGGRWDIGQAARSLAAEVAEGRRSVESVDEEAVASRLALAGCPDPDLLIRTGGERRISNFLLWNLAYTELYFSDTLWPDFDAAEFHEALAYFAQRKRRYGRTQEQLEVG